MLWHKQNTNNAQKNGWSHRGPVLLRVRSYGATLNRLMPARMHRLVALVLQGWHRLHFFAKLSFGLTSVLIAGGLGYAVYQSQLYNIDQREMALVGKSFVAKDKITETAHAYTYNMADHEQRKPAGQGAVKEMVLAANRSDSTPEKPYKALLAKSPSDGIEFGDADGNNSFRILPLNSQSRGRLTESGNVMYPANTTSKHIYTFKRNGIKQDIVLTKATKDVLKYSWRLDLGNTLEARMLPDGSVGIYAADQRLFGNVQVGDEKSGKLIEKARTNSQKTDLVFILPAPFIVDKSGQKNYKDVSYTLKQDVITLTAKNLKAKTYPLSIDPTIVVTTTSDFVGGRDEANISYSTADVITRSSPALASSAPWNTTSNPGTNRSGGASVVYNGFIYTVGGGGTSTSTVYAAINSDGTLGTWATASTNYSSLRDAHSVAVYNGYIYVLGGILSGSEYNDVQYALICTGSNSGVGGCNSTPGNLGTWNATSSFTTGRRLFSATAYNGYLYLSGGDAFPSGDYSDVQYALICTGSNSGVGGCGSTAGAVGTWLTTTSMSTTRNSHVMLAYGNYMYAVGGTINGSTNTNTVVAAPIKADGTLGSWASVSSMQAVRQRFAATIYGGYLYAAGGYTGSIVNRDIEAAKINNDGTLGTWAVVSNMPLPGRFSFGMVAANGYMYILQGQDLNADQVNSTYYAPINADRTIGSYTTSITRSFTNQRDSGVSVAYNGYLYILGGITGTATYRNDVQYAFINPDGSLAPWQTTASFTTARSALAAVVANGYMYVIGGYSGAYQSDVQYARINNNGTLEPWAATTSISVARGGHVAVASAGYIYVLGGLHATSDTLCHTAASVYCSDVQYAAINANGTLGTWTQTTKFTTPRNGLGTGMYNGYIYVVGGYNGTTYQNDVQYASLNSDGSVGTWNATTSFTNGRFYHTTSIHNGYLYIAAGTNGTQSAYSDIQYAPLNGNGTITAGAWVTSTGLVQPVRRQAGVSYQGFLYILGGENANLESNGTNLQTNEVQYIGLSSNGSPQVGLSSPWTPVNRLDIGRSNHTSVAVDGYLYVISGSHTTSDTACHGSSSTYCSDVLYSRISENGLLGTWMATNSLPTARENAAIAAFAGYIYILGGENSSLLSDVQYAKVNTDGSLDAWASTTALSSARSGHAAAAYNGYLYTIGGNDGSYLDTVQYALICTGLNNGTGGCGATPGTIGTWGNANTGASFTVARSDHGATIYNGYIYVVGGSNGSALSTVQYAPVNSNGTIGTWASTTGLTSARYAHAVSVLNGIMYVVGGSSGSADLGTTEYAQLNSDGTITSGAWAALNTLLRPKSGLAVGQYMGKLYVSGGSNFTAVEYMSVIASPRVGYYEKVLDSGQSGVISSFTINGQSSCGYRLNYRTAGDDGIYGTSTTASYVMPGSSIAIASTSARYLWVAIAIDDQLCGSTSSVTDISATYSYNVPAKPNVGMPISLSTPSLRAYGNSFASSMAPTITVPATTEGGDTMFIVTTGGYSPSATPPTGWSLVNRVASGNWQWAIYSKTAAGAVGSVSSDASTVITMSYSNTYDVQSAIFVVEGGNVTPDITYQHNTASAPANTLTDTALLDDLFLYFGSARTGSSNTITLSGGTTDATRTTDTNSGQVIGHQSPSMGSVSQTFTPSVAGTGSFYVILRISRAVEYTSPTTVSTTTPTFYMLGSQANDSYLRYKFDVCSTSDCSSIVRTIDQTSSQVGWSGQDQQVSTAYTGAATDIYSTIASHAYQAPALSANTQYWWRAYAIDPAYSNTWSAPSDIRAFRTNGWPSTPSLMYPADTATKVDIVPQLAFQSTDPDGDYIQYKLELCSTSNCSVVLSTYDQTISQVGWQSQSQQNTTAYASGENALYAIQSALTNNTQYWWRVSAIDPGGSSTWSTPSSIYSFTTTPDAIKVQIGGSTVIGRGTRLGN